MKSSADSKITRNQAAKNRSQRESGQIVIFMAFLLIALVGMAGLAIDGGRLYFEHRDVQNATDAAIQAAVYAKCTNRDIIPAAIQAAEDNGLEIDQNTTVWAFSPPITGTAEGDDEYVEVVISSRIDPYFIQVVYHDDLSVSARAVGRCIPDKLAGAFRGAMYSAAPGPCSGSCNNGLKVTGAAAEITGDLHSNCDIQLGGGGQFTIINGDVSLVSPAGNWNDSKVDFNGAPPETSADPMPFPEYFDITDYRPFTNAAWVPNTGLGLFASQAMAAGEYHIFNCSSAGDTIRNNDIPPLLINGDRDLTSGLYYSACNVHFQNMGDLIGVTIVAEGSIKINGNDNMMTPYPLTPALSLFSNYGGQSCNANAINLSGSHTEWHGVLYAPNGGIDNSASNTRGFGAMIGWVVAATGSDSYIEWDDTLLPPTPPQIGIAE